MPINKIRVYKTPALPWVVTTRLIQAHAFCAFLHLPLPTPGEGGRHHGKYHRNFADDRAGPYLVKGDSQNSQPGIWNADCFPLKHYTSLPPQMYPIWR